MGLYFAVMVIWVITVAANDGLNTSDLHDLPSEDFSLAKFAASSRARGMFRRPGGSDTSNLPSADYTSSASTSTSVYRAIMDSIDFLENANSGIAGLSQMTHWPR